MSSVRAQDLEVRRALPSDDATAIPMLRRALKKADDPHYEEFLDGPLGRSSTTAGCPVGHFVGLVSRLDAQRDAILDFLYLPHVLDGTVATANQIPAARLRLVQRQQFRKMVLEHESKLLVLRSLGPLSGKPVAQAGVGDLRDQVVDG